MNMLEMLAGARGGDGFKALAEQFQLDPQQAESVAKSVLPALSSGAKRAATTPDGLSALAGMLRSNEANAAFDAPEQNQGVAEAEGGKLLDSIFGSARGDVENAVAGDAAAKAGVDAGLVQKMLPMIAGMLLGGMQKKETEDSSISDVVGSILPGGAGADAGAGGGLLGGLASAVGGMLGGGGASSASTSDLSGALGPLAGMLDADGDGSVADDLIGRFLK